MGQVGQVTYVFLCVTRGTGDLNVSYVLHVGNFAISHIHWDVSPHACVSAASSSLHEYQGVGRLSMHKQYIFTTNALNTYLSAQASSSSAFVINKTRIVGSKATRKTAKRRSAIFRILSWFRPLVKRR